MKPYDFRIAQRKSFPVTMGSEDNPITVRVLMPTKGHVDMLTEMGAAFEQLANATTDESVEMATGNIYSCFSFIISSNIEGRIFTPGELRETYRIGLMQIVDFLAAFSEFISDEVKN